MASYSMQPVSVSPPSTTASDTDDLELRSLLDDIKKLDISRPVSRNDISLVASHIIPTASPTSKSTSYVILAEWLAPDSSPTSSSAESGLIIKDYVQSRISDSTAIAVLEGLSLLEAVLTINSEVGKDIVTSEGFLDSIMDMADLPFFSKAVQMAGGSEEYSVQSAIARLLSAAANIPSLRHLIKSRAAGWLTAKSKGSTITEPSKELNVVCAVTLAKLVRAGVADPLLRQDDNDDEAQEQTATDSSSHSYDADDGQISQMLKTAVISGVASKLSENQSKSKSNASSDASIVSAVEGLVYTSLNPLTKELLSSDKVFLNALFALATNPSSNDTAKKQSTLSPSYSLDLSQIETSRSTTALAYGITALLLNIAARPPVLTEEQKQVAKLKKMASSGKRAPVASNTDGAIDEEENPLETNQAANQRVKRLLKAGAVKAVSALAMMDSIRVKEATGQLILELIWEQEDRLVFIQQGGGKVLLRLVGVLLGNSGKAIKKTSGKDDIDNDNDDPSLTDKTMTNDVSTGVLSSLQALAKLIITTPPLNLFGPNFHTSALDSVRPLAHLLQHPQSTLLQRFESMMGLTNLASVDPEVASRIMSQGEDFLRKVEDEMLEDHELVRRAAVELICNLVTSEEGFCRYSGEIPGTDTLGKEPTSTHRTASKNRLRILLAMTDVEDLPTRLAAAGGLASLVQSPLASESLLSLDGNATKAWERIVSMLRPFAPDASEEDENEGVEEISTSAPDPGLVHRALVIAVDLLTYTNTLPTSERNQILESANRAELPLELLSFLGLWTSPSKTVGTIPPQREVVDATVECLKLLKAGGLELKI